MREIKFRGWYGKQMNYNLWIGQNNVNNIFEDEDIVWMQYTGLKDKNGKEEIYFNDYCNAKFKTKEGVTEVSGKIIFNEYMICLETREGEIYSVNRLHDFEVIGNIYENPELIKDWFEL